MTEEYKRIRAEQERKSRMTGIILAVALHVCLVVFGVFSGFSYIYPPPQEEAILLDFSNVEEIKIRPKTGRQPRAEQVDKDKNIELIKQSEAQHVGQTQNVAEESTIGPDGDVEVPEPPREKEINKKALFSSASNKTNKDTLAAQTAKKVTDALSEGHALGNTKKGKTTGEPNAHLKGRHVEGNLPVPSYAVQESGTVVVRIWVDNFGKVKKAIPDGPGTTVSDKTLLSAARNAAMKSHFDMSSDAPVLQEGTITYIFNLN